MKSIFIQIISFSLISTIFINCEEKKRQHKETAPEPVVATESEASSYSVEKHFYINDSTNTSLAEIVIGSEELAIKAGDFTLFGILKNAKRKYYNLNDEHDYSVKLSDGGFKLRDYNEQLLWKVKLKENKISVADNENMDQAFEIKLPEPGRIKLEQNDEKLNSIRFMPSDVSMKVNGVYSIRNFNQSLSPGILLIDSIEPIQKYILCAEILAAGK